MPLLDKLPGIRDVQDLVGFLEERFPRLGPPLGDIVTAVMVAGVLSVFMLPVAILVLIAVQVFGPYGVDLGTWSQQFVGLLIVLIAVVGIWLMSRIGNAAMRKFDEAAQRTDAAASDAIAHIDSLVATIRETHDRMMEAWDAIQAAAPGPSDQPILPSSTHGPSDPPPSPGSS